MKNRTSKRAKACDIPLKVRLAVSKRDNGKCIICGQAGIPNSHYIKRGQGGLGIEQNIVCMCLECHNAYDNGKDEKKAKMIHNKVKSYLKRQYNSWSEEDLIYKKGWGYMKVNKKIIDEIVKYKKEIKGLGYDFSNIFLVLNKNKFKNNKFELLGFSVIYEDIEEKEFIFKEFRKKKNWRYK